MNLSNTTILITGGTGSFGRACIAALLRDHNPKAIRVFSRDELKQSELAKRYADEDRLRFLVGDVRDLERLRMATRGVDFIIHAAALKQVVSCEYNPFEAVHTNVLGAQNVATAAIENEVPVVVGLSSDKGVAPTNLYGASKLLAERIFAQAGVYAPGVTRFASVRYGNVVGSRGSVIPIFLEQAQNGFVTLTDRRMTRFWITLDQAVEFVLSCIPLVEDGEVFVPKIPSAKIIDLAQALAPDFVVTGVRPGEKLHECLLTEDEARGAYGLDDRYVILPHRTGAVGVGARLPDGFRYTSDTNDQWLSVEDLREFLDMEMVAA